ncbi:MAG: double-stranded RNA binding motif domain-containing protein, partial [Thermosynechococcaceae cyanobacterium]
MSTAPQPQGIIVRLTEAQLGYLAYLYPDDDPEEALVKLLERDRLRALRKAEQHIKVLHLDNAEPEVDPIPESESEVEIDVEIDNPIGTLQEYCQQTQATMPSYSFEAIEIGFSCTVEALGLRATEIGSAKK